MARKVILLVCGLLAGCQSVNHQPELSAAASAKATTQTLAQSLPARLPDSCTGDMPAANPKAGEPWVILQKRWLMIRQNRNDQAVACARWWSDYRNSLSGDN